MKKTILLCLMSMLFVTCSKEEKTEKEQVIKCSEKTTDGAIYIVIDNQEELEEFASLGYTNVKGSISISNVDNLSALTCMQHVDKLEISSIAASTLSGLDNLNTVGELMIANCDEIKNMEGLGALKKVEKFTVIGNDNLLNFKGLSSLKTLEELEVFSNLSLLNFDGLENLKHFTPQSENYAYGSINIRENPALTSIAGINNIMDPMPDLKIYLCTALTDFGNFENITSAGFITLNSADALKELDAFNKLNEAQGISFLSCRNLETAKFPSLNKLGHLKIDDNLNFSSLQGFSELTLAETIKIDNNPKLLTLDGLEKLSTTIGMVSIDGYASLINMCALELLVNNYLAQGDVIHFPQENHIDAYSKCIGGMDFLIDFYGTCDCTD